MTDPQRLMLVRALHTAIYVIMATAVLLVLFAGLTGATGPWLWVALALVGIEVVVFAGSGMKCPLTAVVARYSGERPLVSDTFFPERCTRHTLRVFGPLIGLGVLLLAIRWIL
ncbi:MAG: hypothetical protein KF842_07790 [Caulobacter sp.]|nr:hypothetical protein [Caulobacter sp.]